MNRLATATVVLAVAAGGAVATAAPASADDRTCRGTISKQTISGDLVVPSGASCRVNSLDVKGNITIGRGATLRSYHSSVDGNIQLEGNRGHAQNVIRSRTDGDIQLFSNPKGAKYVYDNRVHGNLQCKSNTPAPKGWGNRVSGDKEGQCARL